LQSDVCREFGLTPTERGKIAEYDNRPELVIRAENDGPRKDNAVLAAEKKELLEASEILKRDVHTRDLTIDRLEREKTEAENRWSALLVKKGSLQERLEGVNSTVTRAARGCEFNGYKSGSRV